MKPRVHLSAAWTMFFATLLFAGMGLAVKKASAFVSTAEIVFFRGLVGALIMGMLAWLQKIPLSTKVPRQHLGRTLAGVSALCLWFYAMGRLPLATAVTLNYMSSIWIAVFLMLRQFWLNKRQHNHTSKHQPISSKSFGAVLFGFLGVALVLQPTLEKDQWFEGLMGLISGILAALAYLQLMTLGRSGEPEQRVVFYFSCASMMVGLAWLLFIYPDFSQWHWPFNRSWSVWGWLISTGVFATAAQLALTRAFAQGQALSMASLQYLGIVHAFVLGILLFDEPLHGLSVLGAVLIVVAGISANRMRTSIGD